MDQNVLFDMLGILVGFVGIMLILSLLVTALTQFLVSLFSLRARNLRFGLDRLLEQAIKPKPDAENLKNTKRSTKELLDSNSLTKASPLRKTTWILEDELKCLLQDSGWLGEEQINAAMKWFYRMERGLSQRFQTIVRVITFGCAIVVAVVFQVSAPEILTRLSTDTHFREGAVLAAEELVAKYGPEDLHSMRYEDVSEKALERLQENNADLAEQLEEVSGVGQTLEDILAEMSLVFEEHPKRKSVMTDYQSLLQELERENVQRAQQLAQDVSSRLAYFDIVPFSKGSGYYWSVPNVLGMLMTAVFISLGAPFWFNNLRRLMSLRDFLAPEKASKERGQGKDGSGSSPGNQPPSSPRRGKSKA